MSFSNASNSEDGNAGILTLPGYEVREVRQYSQSVFVTIFNRTTFNGVALNQCTTRPINFSLVVTNLVFTNRAAIFSYSQVDINPGTLKYTRQLKIVDCNFSESSLDLLYMNVNISISNCTFDDGTVTAMQVLYSKVVFGGRLVFNHSIGFNYSLNIQDTLILLH